MTRRGKIARLPRAVREELNRRLQNGEASTHLLAWLNDHPETKRVLAEGFAGREINEPNLSEWRTGGYQEWLTRQEALEQARDLKADAREMAAATDGGLTDHLATVLTLRYASVLANGKGPLSGKARRELNILRTLCHDVVELRRGDQHGFRLSMEQERLNRQREKSEVEVWEQFERWVANPEVREWLERNKNNQHPTPNVEP